jgi:hypothetical protein
VESEEEKDDEGGGTDGSAEESLQDGDHDGEAASKPKSEARSMPTPPRFGSRARQDSICSSPLLGAHRWVKTISLNAPA